MEMRIFVESVIIAVKLCGRESSQSILEKWHENGLEMVYSFSGS